MKEQAGALERLNRDMKLSSIPFHVVDRKGRHVKPPVRKDTCRYEYKRSSRRSNKGRASAKNGQSQTKARHDSDQNSEAADDYELVLRDGEVLIMATDTDEFKSAAGENGTKTQSTGLDRIERTLESMSHDQWERGMGNHLYKFQLSLASNSAADLNSFDSDIGNKTIPIIIDADKQSRAFVGETTKLDECVYDETDSMLFCVAYICITETDQMFIIQEPCEQPCRHIELQIMNKWLEKPKLPCMLDFQSITCGASVDEMAETESVSSFILECYYRCPHRKPCSHTVLEGVAPVQDGGNGRMIVEDSETLQVWLNSSEQELDTPTEGTEEPDTSTGGPGSLEDDIQSAMALLEMVHRQDNNVPAQIPFETLVGYLKLVERLQLDVVHRVQCHTWADALVSEVSNSFDEKTIAWAWVNWKLRRGAEFKTLTVMMQKEGKHLIGEETNQYGVSLPPHTIGKYLVSL